MRSAGNSWGLNYKHAFNLGNDVFIAPGIFFERNDIKADTGGAGQVKIKNRRGIKLDLGYDVDANSAIYLTTGWGQISYGSEITRSFPREVLRPNKYDNGMFYGIGIAHNINKDFATNLEFTTQTAKIDAGYSNSFKTDLRVVKVGASYRF